MKRLIMLPVITSVFVVICSSYATESDDPPALKWTFQMEKTWEIQQIGGDELLRPAEPRVADDGTLYWHDFERHLSYIVDSDGKLVNTFAPRGSGEGELSMYLNCFPAGDYVVICSMDKLHFFTKKGQFVKAVPNNPFVHFPLAFRSENEFWVAPGALGDAPGSLAVVTQVNLASGKEKTVHEFERTDIESRPTGGALVVGLTPQIKMGYDPQSDRAYFGKNSDTVIYCLAGDGSEVKPFSFTGVRHPVTESDKRNHFAKFNIPEERLAAMINVLPDHTTYYNRLQVVGGLVYLFSADGISNTLSGLTVNIYSPDGRHRYYGQIRVEEGWHISNTDNLQLANGYVYAVQENKEGKKKIVKYKTALPES
jgi:hypothetical protein